MYKFQDDRKLFSIIEDKFYDKRPGDANLWGKDDIWADRRVDNDDFYDDNGLYNDDIREVYEDDKRLPGYSTVVETTLGFIDNQGRR